MLYNLTLRVEFGSGAEAWRDTTQLRRFMGAVGQILFISLTPYSALVHDSIAIIFYFTFLQLYARYIISFKLFSTILSVFSFDVNTSVDRLFKLSWFPVDCEYLLFIPQSPRDRSVVSLRFSNHTWPSMWILSISTIYYSQSLVFSCPYPFVNSLVIALHLTVFRRLVCQYGRYCSHLKWHFRLVIELFIDLTGKVQGTEQRKWNKQKGQNSHKREQKSQKGSRYQSEEKVNTEHTHRHRSRWTLSNVDRK